MHDCSLTPACYFDKTWNLLLHFLKEIKSNRLDRTEAIVFQRSIPWLQFFSNFVDDLLNILAPSTEKCLLCDQKLTEKWNTL